MQLGHPAPPPPGLRLGRLALLTGAVALALGMLQQLLVLPAGWGIEDMLGWTAPEPVAAMRRIWAASLGVRGLGAAPTTYLLLDIALFMPLYAALAIGGGVTVSRAFVAHAGWPPGWRRAAVLAAVPGLTLALLAVDAVENLGGLQRLGAAWAALPAALLAIAVGLRVYRRYPALADTVQGLRPLWRPVAAAGLLALGAAVATSGGSCGAGPTWLWSAGCRAHAAKPALIGGLLLWPAALGAWVLFGPHHQQQRWARGVLIRRAVFGMAWRSRYVLATLALVAWLVVGMNQGRDVIYALAAHPFADDGSLRPLHALWAAVALALTALATWALGYACWLWARLAGLVRARTPDAAAALAAPNDHQFARDWARALGAAPALLGAIVCMVSLRDAAAVQRGGAGPVLALIGIAAAILIGGLAFVWRRTRDTPRPDGRYFDALPLAELQQSMPRYKLFGLITPLALPLAALALAIACRAAAAFAMAQQWPLPSLALPVMLLLLTFWLGVAGWLSLHEQSESVPLVPFALAWIGLLGVLGWADNHVVAASLQVQGLGMAGLILHGSVLAAVFGALVWLGLWLLRSGRLTPWRAGALGVAGALLMAGVLLRADREAARPLPAAGAAPVAAPLPAALAGWLRQLDARELPQALPVYFVAAEGGGIRSAYWTASVLNALYRDAPDALQRTFAMSGVSGGSLGLAVYRACRAAAAAGVRDVQHCVDGLGRADLLAPLLGAWFFEDVLARLLPQQWCEQPGCGLLSRSLWFERALHDAVPGLALGLRASHRGLAARTGHEPYLLLNSTWVETGERSVASELRIDWRDLPVARDQLAQLGAADLALVTAAHNSARFPFTNAIGAVKVARGDCVPAPPAPEAAAPRAEEETQVVVCGHLADGGYFDNSAGHGVADVLVLLGRCLRGEAAACPGIDAAARARLSARLQPQVLLIRTGVVAEFDPQTAGVEGADTEPRCPSRLAPSAAQVSAQAGSPGVRQLGRPQCAGGATLFADALGPLITALNSTGIGANGRLAAARQRQALQLLARSGEPRAADIGAYDLVDDGPLFPLGWHLSTAAQAEMRLRSTGAQLPDAGYGGADQAPGSASRRP